jgi:2-polyprenyl-3-methyl-5-hydroxy-6-metoxy-1,4-benzoquinol methylase
MNSFNPSYIDARDDILKYIPNQVGKVLDVGCSIGVLGKKIKEKYAAEVTGIEMNDEMARIAKKNLDRIIIGDVEEICLSDYFTSEYFDCIIVADILEHLRDPWTVLNRLSSILSEKGLVISSIPNVRHYTTILQLTFKGYWPYRDRGIHDRTHLRFFALTNIKELFDHSGLKIKKIEEKYRLIERPHPYNRFSRYFAFSFIKPLLVFQYIVLAEK